MAVLVTAVVAVLGVLAPVLLRRDSLLRDLLHLDGEFGVPAAWSAALLLAAGLAGWAQRRTYRWYGVLGALLFVLGLDEAVLLHERLEQRTGVDWQLLYAPVAAVAAVAFVVVAVRLLRSGQGHRLAVLTGGFACWGISQVLERVQWHGDVKVARYAVLMTVEEVLEMTGSLLVLVALCAALRPAAHDVQ